METNNKTNKGRRVEPLEIEPGDRVFYRPEWMDDGDEDHEFYATERALEGFTLDVVCTTTGMTLEPHQRVRLDMISHGERT